MVKNLPANVGDVGSIPGSGRSPGVGMATHSSVLAWKIPWTEEPGGLQFTGSQRVRHDLACRHIKSNGPTCQSFFIGVQICHTLWSKNKKHKPHEY